MVFLVRRLDKTPLCAVLSLVKDNLLDLIIKMSRGKLVCTFNMCTHIHLVKRSQSDRLQKPNEGTNTPIIDIEDEILHIMENEALWEVCSSRTKPSKWQDLEEGKNVSFPIWKPLLWTKYLHLNSWEYFRKMCSPMGVMIEASF